MAAVFFFASSMAKVMIGNKRRSMLSGRACSAPSMKLHEASNAVPVKNAAFADACFHTRYVAAENVRGKNRASSILTPR